MGRTCLSACAAARRISGLQEGSLCCRSCARCGQCFYCNHGFWSACSTTNPSREEEQLYGHRTAGFYGALRLHLHGLTA